MPGVLMTQHYPQP